LEFNPLPLIIIIILLAIVFTWVRVGGSRVRRRPDFVQRLIYEVRLNQALVETYHLREKPRKFETTAWRMSQDNIDFLDDSLQQTLTDLFTTVGEFNEQIKAARKTKVFSQLNIDVNKIKEPLAESRKGLEDWLEEMTGQRELPSKYPSIFGWWFGQG